MYRFDLHWEQVNERSDLKLAIWPLSPGEAGRLVEPIDDVTFLEDVEAFSIAYFKLSEADGKTQWLNQWTEESLPALIRIEITVQGEPPWPRWSSPPG